MKDRVSQPAGDGLEQAVAVALETVVRRREVRQDQAEMLRVLRRQLGQVLAEAPVRGNALDGIAFRARLAALLEDEIGKLEARTGPAGRSLAPEETPFYQERRRWPRHPVRLSAQVSTGAFTFDCVVVDLSEGGAQVNFAAPVPLPERVTLNTGNGEVFLARRCWTKGTRTGLEFTGAASMSGQPSGTGT